MKSAVVLLALAALAMAGRINVKDQFDSFIAKFGKSYAGDEEYNRRLGYFEHNMKKLAIQRASMSRNRATSWNADVTFLFDLSEDEKSYYTGRQKLSADGLAISCLSKGVTSPAMKLEATPTSWDWRTKGVVNPIKNQGQCGSCWAFSTIGTIESKYAIKGNTLTSFSEQEVVDCSTGCSMEPPYGKVCNQGCNGGWQWNAFYDIISWGGVDLESQYVYTAQTGTCKKNQYTAYAPISNYTCLSTPQGATASEDNMAAYLVQNGPIAIAMDAGLLETYSGGIINPQPGDCSQVQLDHAIIIVGFDTDASAGPYWIVRNSWGTSWGESGYFRIVRGKNACGLAAAVSAPLM
jgi:cathepsin F